MLKAIDITYGFNGEASTATVTESASPIGCSADSLGSIVGDIDLLLRGYEPIRVTETNDAGFKSETIEYVDSGAAMLDSIAVLVRGITASAFEEWNSFQGRMFNFAETDYIDIGERGETEPKRYGQILVLGKVISVVAASSENGNDEYYEFWSGGEKIGRTPKESFPEEVQEKFENFDFTGSLKFGYTPTQLKEGLELFGYSTEGFPESDPLTLIETGGTLRDCISSVASLYGLYWMCRGYQIKFFSRADILEIEIPNYVDSDSKEIISASYTDEYLGKSRVGVISGNATENSSPHSYSGYGGSSGAKNRSIFFKLMPTKVLFGPYYNDSDLDVVRAFYTLFLLESTEETFCLAFFIALFNKILLGNGKGNIKDLTESFIYTRYKNNNQIASKEAKNLKSFKEEEQLILKKHTKSDNLFYNLSCINGDDAILPTRDNTYQFIKAACDIYASIYISRPVSKYVSEKYSLTPAEGFAVSRAYKGNTLVTEIDELSSYATVMSAIFPNGSFDKVTIEFLARAVYGFKEGEGFTLKGDNAHFYIAKKSISQTGTTFEAAQKAHSTLIESTAPMPSIPIEALEDSLLPFHKERQEKIIRIFQSSHALISEVEKLTDRDLRMSAVKLQNPEKDFDGDSGDYSDEDKKELLGKTEMKSLKVVQSFYNQLSPVDILTFDSNLDEANFLATQFDDLTGGAQEGLDSSSTTWFGFKPPEPTDPSLSSLSVSISDSSVNTTINYSKREILGVDQSIVMAGFISKGNKNTGKTLRSRQRNFLRIT